MLNKAQIEKLMRKTGKKVQEKFDKIAEQERKQKQEQQRERNKHLDFIREQINIINNENPKRGPCVCVWKNEIYGVVKNWVSRASLSVEEIGELSLEMIKTIDDKYFYMFSEAMFKETEKTMHWMSEHYAEIKIALARLNPNSSNLQWKDQDNLKSKLFEMYRLGSIFQDFLKEFPGKSIFYFKECISAFDKMMQNHFNELEDEEKDGLE